MSGEGDERASRPCSLVLEAPPPEREPLHFDVQLVGAPPEVEQLVNNIKQVAEDFLYHWKTFPIVLPPSRFTGPGNRPSDIIVPPPCDEIDAAALDAGVEPLPLTPKQLHSIREKGEFEVPSRHFPGQTHVWRVAGWLQRGRERAREQLYCHVARSLALVVVVARDRLLRDQPVSVIAGGKCLLQGLHRLVDLAFGLPSLEARDLDKKIREERSRYLVAELICKPENQEDIAALAAWVTRAMRRAAAEKTDVREPPRPPPPVPCLYTTPQRTQVDLRLYRRELVRRASGVLQALLEREARGWFLHFRERRAALLANQKMPMKDIEEEVRDAAMREYVSRVCNAVTSSEALAALGPDVPELLAQQLRASAIVARAEEGVRRKLEAALASAEARIRASHPILSRAAAWRAERVARAELRARTELRWTAMEDAAADMQAHKLHQHRYFLLRDLTFLRDREPLLMKELRVAVSPTRTFRWARRVWAARRWAVTRHWRGRRERVPTALAPRPALAPRSDPAQPVFLLQTDTVAAVTTRWPAWRLLVLAHRTWCWCWNLMYTLGVLVPWCSPLSLRTLLCVKPFVTDYELSQVNGTLYPKRSSETQTMWSRLLTLWRHVSKERTRFETEPDTGLLGKGLSRQANRFWNYGIVGGVGSLALLLGLPLVVVLVCSMSAILAVTVPLWVPPLAIGMHVTNALVYDVDCPNPEKLNRWFPLLEVVVWRIGVLGILQPFAALLLAVLFCPLAALLLLVGGILWWCVRGVWECCAWRAVLARGARAPAHDSAFCRRVRGPGLHQPAYYLITSGQALAAVMSRAELQALNTWATELERAIERPLRDYEHFVKACFGPFSVQIAKTGAYKQLEKECSELTASLRDKVAARRRELALPLSDAARQRVRMTSEDLRCVVHACAAELSSGGWWSRGTDAGECHAAALDALAEALAPDVLLALPPAAARLPLDAGAGERVWAERAARTHHPQHSHPPDVLAERDHWPATHDIWCSWGGSAVPRVSAPALELSAFSARAPQHPPVPCGAGVALVLHNRDSDNPVPLDSELCAEILRSLEDAPDCDDKREDVERYRGGGSSGSSSSSDSPDDDEPSERNDHYCRVSGRAACRWTLTGRGVRLRADLASPEDVSLDAERAHGTSV